MSCILPFTVHCYNLFTSWKVTLLGFAVHESHQGRFAIEVTVWICILSEQKHLSHILLGSHTCWLCGGGGVGSTGISLFCNMCKHCSRVEQSWNVQTSSLTSGCWVHSNVYGLGNIHWIRYHTAVDPIHSTSSAVQMYPQFTFGSVEIPQLITAGNFSSIGKKPVLFAITIRFSTTSSEFSPAEQGTIPTFTNVL